MVTVTRFFLICATLLALPAVTAADESAPTLSPVQGPVGTPVIASASDWTGCTSMSVSGWGIALAKTTINSSGAFSLSFTVPPGAPLGAQQLQFSPACSHSTWMPFVTFTVTSVSALADLSPTAILYNSADLVPGKTVLFDSGVQNSGSQGTGVFNVRWFVDGVSVGYGSHAGVPANSTVLNGNSQYSWPATAGTHTIKFVVDSDNQVLESNESNNSISVTVTISATTPAAPSGLTATPSSTSIALKWKDNSNNETGFELFNGNTYVKVRANTTSYTWGGLKPGQYMCVSVRSYNTAGSSAFTPYACTTTTTAADTTAPSVSWTSPVGNSGTSNVSSGSVTLAASASDNVGVARVKFTRWDAVGLKWVDIATVTSAPWQTSLAVSALNSGYNQINVQAWDAADNASGSPYIWINRTLPTSISCPDAPFVFPVPSVDNSGKNSFVGWLYKESTEGKIWGVTKNLHWIDGKGWIDPSMYHSGLDFWASPGTPVMGQATGKVYAKEYTGPWSLTISYPDITYVDIDGKEKKGVYVYIDNLVNGNIIVDGKTKEIKVPDVGSDVNVNTIIGLVGNYYVPINGQQHIHWSVSPKPYTDQAPISTPESKAIQLDPTQFLTPKGNLNYATGAREHRDVSLSWWCNGK